MTSVNITASLPNINKPIIDKATGLMDMEWYHFFEKLLIRTGGVGDFIATNTNEVSSLQGSKADKTIDVIAGNGLTGGGTLAANVTLSAKKDTGWTASTGAGSKGAYAQYAGQTMGAAYVQAAAQQTDDAIKAIAARVVALEAAMRANGGID